MLNPWLILASVAFAVSFGVGFLMTQVMGVGLIAGSMAALTAFVTTATVNWYRNHSMDGRTAALRQQIRMLQRQRAGEHQAILEMSAEKDRVAQALQSMQDQLRQYQLPGSPSPQPQRALSWNLAASEPTPAIAPAYSEYADPNATYEMAEADLNQFLLDAAATKQKIIASLNNLQGELSHLNAQIADHRQARDHLVHEIQSLQQQKQQLAASSQQLQADLEELERCRVELDQYISYVETKKQEIEGGSNPLQQALKQLQGQVTALQEELRQLESKVTARRAEKDQLDREIAALKKQEQTAGKGKSDAGKALQADLEQLTQEIYARQAEKASLEEQLIQLQTQQINVQGLAQEMHDRQREHDSLQREISSRQKEQQALQRDISDRQKEQQSLQRDISDRQKERQSLQKEIAQLQTQRSDLQKLENQIKDRRKEKESLEKQIAQLQAQKSSLRSQSNPSESKHANSKSSSKGTSSAGANGTNGKAAASKGSSAALQRPSNAPSQSEDVEEKDVEEEDDLPEMWTELMVQLSDDELQTLKAIALESNPLRILNRIAEDNFSTVEELVDGINQRSQETIGESVIKSKSGFSPPIIFREHQPLVKKMIETYEYLNS